MSHVIDPHPVADGAFRNRGPVITVEADCQGTDAAAAEAERQARAFLAVTGVLPNEDVPGTDPDHHLLNDAVGKPPDAEYELLAGNVQRVAAGETFARAGDGELVAHRPFHPVLMSECGYEDVFGYRAGGLGESPAAAPATLGIDPATGGA